MWPAPRILPTPGEPFAGYLIERELGRGGIATVFLARDGDGRPVALKVLDEGVVDGVEVHRLVREYRVLSRVDHPHVVRVHRCGVEGTTAWLSMEYVHGTDLEALIERWRDHPPPDRAERAERLLRQLCEGLAAVHAGGLVHRDLKPSNVLLDGEGRPRIADFGVVTGDRVDAVTAITQAGRLVGTVAFMAPELITTDQVDARTDLYALGAILYLLLTGHRPVEATSVAGYLARHLSEVPRSPAEWEPSTPPHLERICLRLLQKDPARRFPSAQAVLAALDGAADATTALRGREQELTALTDAIRRARGGVGGFLLVSGPPGIGRSAVLEAALAIAVEQGLDVRVARARSGPVVPTLMGRHGVIADPSGVDTVAQALAGDGPRLLAIDDLDLAEDVAVEVLTRVVRLALVERALPVLVLATTTSTAGPIATLASGHSTGMMAERWGLAPLDRPSTVSLLRDRGLVGPVAPILGRRLHQAWICAPGVIVEMLGALVDHGWVAPHRDGLAARRPIDAFRKSELPVPSSWFARIDPVLERLTEAEREVLDLLAVVGRPASGALVARCADTPEHAATTLDALVLREILHRDILESQEVFSVRDPALLRVLHHHLSDARRRALHGRVATVLGSRRRADPVELATHHEAAGDVAAAWKAWIAAARRQARGRSSADVVDHVERALALETAVAATMSAEERAPHAVWLRLLLGESLLAKGQWKAAIDALREALVLARTTGADAAVGRCLAALGRGLYRAGDHSSAQPLLVEAVAKADGPERIAALRTLADVVLRGGDLSASESLWRQAVTEARDADAEARARRGLANALVVAGHLVEANEHLGAADELLSESGDPRVRAAVLCRLVELDLFNGAVDAARTRLEALVSVLERHELHERAAEVWSLRAQLAAAMGAVEPGLVAAQQAISWCRVPGAPVWEVEIRVARCLLDWDHGDELGRLALVPEAAPNRPLDDPPGLVAAVRARIEARRNPARATDLARWAMMRDTPFAMRRVAGLADIAHAFLALGDRHGATQVLDAALERNPVGGSDAMRVELLALYHQATGDPRWCHEASSALTRIASRPTGPVTIWATNSFGRQVPLR